MKLTGLIRRRFFVFLAVIALFLLLCFAMLLLFLPGVTTTEKSADPDLFARFDQVLTNGLSHTLDGIVVIPKKYTIFPGYLPPEPQESGFITCETAGEVYDVIDSAWELLGDDDIVAWTVDTELAPGTKVRCYRDETILVLTWQELWEGRVCTWCEVKLAHASQLRRKLSGDSYGSGVQISASELAREDNAVAAVSGDFYAFRSCGIHVWEGEVYLVSGDTADTCFFTRSGDMLFVRAGEITTWEEAVDFVEKNDVSFSVAFGPVLAEDGFKTIPLNYSWGEIYERYARAVISQVGDLHYVFLAANCDSNEYLRATAEEAADLMLSHGCRSAYSLDGGQTASVILNGQLVNRPEFGYERMVSDVICFASAYPGEGKK